MRFLRILRLAGLSTLTVVVVAFAAIQMAQNLLRHRAERLLVDFQAIRLHQSTWADARILMTRWGAWGHYDGQCTASDCVYTVMLADPFSRVSNYAHSDAGYRLLRSTARLYDFLGGKSGWLTMSFLVQDGLIWRSRIGLLLDVPPYAVQDDDYGYPLMLLAKSSDSLHQKPDGPWVLGGDDQLANHPNFKVGRPGACTICLSGQITFTPYISSTELKQVTSFDLSCFTRFRHCVNLPDALPVARNWHLYPNTEPADMEPPPSTRAKPCAVPVLVRSRDASSVLLVEVISTKTTKSDESSGQRSIQTATVRLVQTLKGTPPSSAQGESLKAESWPGDIYIPNQAPELFETGKRYVIFPRPDDPSQKLSLEFCGLTESSPSVLTQVKQGIAQNDHLRGSERFGTPIL